MRTYCLSIGHQTLMRQPTSSSVSISPSFDVHCSQGKKIKSNNKIIQGTLWNPKFIICHYFTCKNVCVCVCIKEKHLADGYQWNEYNCNSNSKHHTVIWIAYLCQSGNAFSFPLFSRASGRLNIATCCLISLLLIIRTLQQKQKIIRTLKD